MCAYFLCLYAYLYVCLCICRFVCVSVFRSVCQYFGRYLQQTLHNRSSSIIKYSFLIHWRCLHGIKRIRLTLIKFKQCVKNVFNYKHNYISCQSINIYFIVKVNRIPITLLKFNILGCMLSVFFHIKKFVHKWPFSKVYFEHNHVFVMNR